MEQPITRALLAAFIDYASRGAVPQAEWSRYMVRNYADERMEMARSECVRILIKGAYARGVIKADVEQLTSIAAKLRVA